jgi:3-deoxy-D-manno-octulosonic-acid transferase
LILYNLAQRIYFFLIRIVSPFSAKAARFISGRSDVFSQLTNFDTGQYNKIFWFHCASLGEFEQGRPLIEALKTQQDSTGIVLTFFSPSGYEVRKNYSTADLVCYLPADSPKNARKFIAAIRPDAAFFVKYEFWYYYFRELNQQNVPVYSISTILRVGHVAFRWPFYRKILAKVNHFFVQDEETATRLSTIHLTNVTISGDTRFDRVADIASKVKELEIVRTFKGKARVMAIGSSWPRDMQLLKPLILNLGKRIKFIIAPHEIDEPAIQEMKKAMGNWAVRYSAAENQPMTDYRVLIVDNIGMLSSVYAYADFAYVGGGFGSGIHNILEPAVFGMPVFFGNKRYQKFREAVDLTNAGAAFPVGTTLEMTHVMEDLLEDENRYRSVSEVGKRYVEDNRGATKKIMRRLQLEKVIQV